MFYEDMDIKNVDFVMAFISNFIDSNSFINFNLSFQFVQVCK